MPRASTVMVLLRLSRNKIQNDLTLYKHIKMIGFYLHINTNSSMRRLIVRRTPYMGLMTYLTQIIRCVLYLEVISHLRLYLIRMTKAYIGKNF